MSPVNTRNRGWASHRALQALDGFLNQLLMVTPPSICWWLGSRRRPACNLSRLLLEGELLDWMRSNEEAARAGDPERNVAVAESDAASELDAWVYSFALLRGLSIDVSPLGIAIIIR